MAAQVLHIRHTKHAPAIITSTLCCTGAAEVAEIEILDSPVVAAAATHNGPLQHNHKQLSPQQVQQQQQIDCISDGDDGDVTILHDSPDARQQQQQQQESQEQGKDSRAGSTSGGEAAGAAADAGAGSAEAAAAGGGPAVPPPPCGWQPPFRLDGSVPLTVEMLLGVLPEFHSAHAMDCAECAASLEEAVAGHQEVKAQVEVQRATLGKLAAAGVTEVLEPGLTYYLVPK